MLDKDSDDKLTQVEYEAGFKLLDIDGDPKFLFETLDTDGDGKISQAEYNKGFDLLDRHKDGWVCLRDGVWARLQRAQQYAW